MQPVIAAAGSMSDVVLEALHATPFQAVTACVALVSLCLAAYTFFRTQLRGPKLSFLSADALGLVRQPAGGLAAIQLMGAVVNGGGSTGVLMRLEIDLTDPTKAVHRFVWDQFYRYLGGGAEYEKTTDPQPIPIKPGEAVTLQVQLRPADGKPRSGWPAGETLVSVVGWANASGRTRKPGVSGRFRVHVSDFVSAALAPREEPAATWVVTRVPLVEWRHPLES